MKSNNNISERIEALQAINLIKNLKFRYWNACDLKKPADISGCFCSDEVYINFEEFGTFSAAKDMVEKYELQSCHAHLIEQHAGKNPIISFKGIPSNGESSNFVFDLENKIKEVCKNYSLKNHKQIKKQQKH